MVEWFEIFLYSVHLGGGEGTDLDSLVISNSSVGSGWYSAIGCLSVASAFSALMLLVW